MKNQEFIPIEQPKTLLVAIESPMNRTSNIKSYFEEFINLVKSNGVPYDEIMYIRLRTIDPGYYISKGKLEELIEVCKKNDIEEVILSESVSPQQEKNLSDALHARIFDRTQLILEIFEKGAHSAEGKTQVELAMLQHLKTRLVGRGLYMSQQAGRIGTRGPGETQKEKETQHIERLMVKLRRQLKELAQHREVQRKKRIGSNIPHVCLIGYTNAGKSTILNALTNSDVLAEDRLFATLDTTTRELYIDHKKKGVISDTVGFIQQLPHNLIEAFKSTLTELQYAHLLLLVVDLSDANWQEHVSVVHEVLAELEVNKPVLYVFNKVDRVTMTPVLEEQLARYQPQVLISATTDKGLEPLREFLKEWKPVTV